MKKFRKIYLEITNVCNLKCKFCSPTNRTPKFIKVDDFDLVLSRIINYTDLIFLHIKGEPLLHPEIDQILNLCSKYNLKVNLTTNGTLLSKVKDKIKNSPSLRQINFSLHSIAENDNVIDVNSYLDNIFTFIKENKNIIYSLRLWNVGLNKNHDVNFHVLKYIENHFNIPNLYESLKTVDSIKLADKVYLNQDLQFNWPSRTSEKSSHKGFCYGLRDHIGVLVDGTVVPCCLDGDGIISLGNIFNQSLDDILTSSLAKEIYNSFSNRDAYHELCKKCDYKKRFL